MTELQTAREAAAAELARIDAELAAQKAANRSAYIASVRALMAEHGLALADITDKPAKLALVKAAAKVQYRSADGQTWAGRGKRPNWLRKALADGKALADFKVAA